MLSSHLCVKFPTAAMAEGKVTRVAVNVATRGVYFDCSSTVIFSIRSDQLQSLHVMPSHNFYERLMTGRIRNTLCSLLFGLMTLVYIHYFFPPLLIPEFCHSQPALQLNLECSLSRKAQTSVFKGPEFYLPHLHEP